MKRKQRGWLRAQHHLSILHPGAREEGEVEDVVAEGEEVAEDEDSGEEEFGELNHSMTPEK